ncbi:MAG: hypothetical protein AAFS03_08600 [Pseudomonadota bacterium]
MTVDRDSWPTLLKEVAEELDDAAAMHLVQRLGGQRLHIPAKPKNTRIEREVGEAIAAFLCRTRSGLYVEIPTFALKRAEERRRYVLQHPHLSANDLAKSLGITSRGVEKIRQRARDADSKQPSLFD